MIVLKKIKLYIFLFLVLGQWDSYSQGYASRANLSKIDKDGFYSIVLSPGITSQLQDNNADVRILNSKNIEVPYIIANEEAMYHSTAFVDYPIVEKKKVPNCCTFITIENHDKKSINNLSVEVKNSDAIKFSELLGSDDAKDWYGIKSTYVFTNESSTSSTSNINVVNFALNNYKYFKIQFSDSAEAPINIVRVGYFNTKVAQGKFIEISHPTIVQKDSTANHKSYVKILLDESHRIDRIDFGIIGSKFYARDAELAYLTENKLHKKYFTPITYLKLLSNKANSFNLPSTIKQKELYLIINNDDNIPLKITSVKAYQLTHYLKAYLTKEETYSIVFNNKNSKLPIYDLQYFMDSIPGILPDVKVGAISSIIHLDSNVEVVKWYENKVFIWIVLTLVIAVMAYMVYSMMRQMEKRQ